MFRISTAYPLSMRTKVQTKKLKINALNIKYGCFIHFIYFFVRAKNGQLTCVWIFTHVTQPCSFTVFTTYNHQSPHFTIVVTSKSLLTEGSTIKKHADPIWAWPGRGGGCQPLPEWPVASIVALIIDAKSAPECPFECRVSLKAITAMPKCLLREFVWGFP